MSSSPPSSPSHRLRALLDQVVTTEQRERKRIANILHDQLQQILVACTLQLDEVTQSLQNKDVAGAADHLDRGKGFLSEAIHTARTLTTELCPSVLFEDGLPAALTWLALKFKREQDLDVLLSLADIPIEVSDNLKILLFESIKELLFNVVKHAHVKTVKLTLAMLPEHGLCIRITDQGPGFAVHDVEPGFSTHAERLKIFGAEFTILSEQGVGTTVEIKVPIES